MARSAFRAARLGLFKTKFLHLGPAARPCLKDLNFLLLVQMRRWFIQHLSLRGRGHLSLPCSWCLSSSLNSSSSSVLSVSSCYRIEGLVWSEEMDLDHRRLKA
mmetsp:Transcript_6965/g.11355  ORF Transcript_6965/g.11355 Transcript_6965/m.11355 type:complete len:103 (+) Transcript_6965:970-1278(+)